MGCSGYDAIAHVYEKLNSEIDYKKWADFIETCFDKHLKERPSLVLDLACGTGTMTRELSRRGYDMIGVDGSAEMLTEAFMQKEDGESTLYLNQDMREFELYGTVGAVTCCLDSINYLLSEEDVKKTFSLVHNYLDPDGLFLFDVNTPYKFEHIYSDNAYILEDELDDNAIYCGWQNSLKADRVDISLDFFKKEKGTYYRSEESFSESTYSEKDIKDIIFQSGLEIINCYDDYSFNQPNLQTQRIVYVTRKV